ncbi:MAG TPA: HlyD family secretion protein [Acidiphilium sp.]|nr:MAG: secretion protein HlyD [Acidiphilium sp. 21-60-14]OYV90904.1 MAG: secretion protein HlyD [Acidiphilium sp. 37-60-79]HQT88289.1 HlyD family secretion protein [Acidiphilium sp.]HQU23338.1 HlyD family secretion protein [Acidiphilium sp.]
MDQATDQNTPKDARKTGTTGGVRKFIILGIVLLGLALAGLIYWLHARHFAVSSDAEIDGPIHPIAPRIAGSVLAVLVHQNEHVIRGQILVRLDPASEQTALARAQAQAREAQAQIALRRARLLGAQAQVEVANADLVKAKQDFARYAAINPQAVTRANRDNATAAERAAMARLDAAKAQVTSAQASLQAAKATAQAAKVAVTTARLQLGYTMIRAPAAGYIADRTVRRGNIVAPGAGLMALVGDRIWVTANFKETQLGRIRPGQQARITIDAVPGLSFHARVASIQHGTGSVFSLLPAENATGNYVKIVQRVPVRLVFNDQRIKKYLITPGMSVEASIRISGK